MNKKYFKSGIFKGLFSSYIIIIFILFISYICAMMYENWNISKERYGNYYASAVEKIANSMDVMFMDAYVIAADINASDIINNYAMQNKDMYSNKVSDISVVSQIKNNLVSRLNINIYDTVLLFDGQNKAFSSVGTYDIGDLPHLTQGEGKVHCGSSVNEIYKINNKEVVFNKEFIIYTQSYNSVYGKGIICVLYDKNCLDEIIESKVSDDTIMNLYINDELAYSKGNVENPIVYSNTSAFNNGIKYRVEIDKSNYSFKADLKFVASIVVAAVFCTGLIIIALYMSGRFYSPLEDIGTIINEKQLKKPEEVYYSDSDSEYKNIIQGIENLIGENNGYKERMISIKPYAQQGMIHGMISGSSQTDKIMCMFTDDYKVLQKQYYIIADINMAYTGVQKADDKQFRRIHHIIEELTSEYSDDETIMVWYDKDDYDTFLIINSDNSNNMENIFYEINNILEERINDKDYVVTIGVDKVRDDISQLSLACHNAVKALQNIITGGRGAVYYYMDDNEKHSVEYYFPADTQQKLTRYVKENRVSDIDAVLDDIMNINMKQNSDNLEVIALMADELHITTAKVLKNIQQDNIVGFSLEKMELPSTLEEIFTYYKAVYKMASEQYSKMAESRNDTNELNQKIINEIDTNYMKDSMSLAYLTDMFGVSNKYITMLCKKVKGMTYIQYVQELRIKKAIEYMQNSDYSLEEIALKCGYANMLTFRRNFKSVMGVNPSEYK